MFIRQRDDASITQFLGRMSDKLHRFSQAFPVSTSSSDERMSSNASSEAEVSFIPESKRYIRSRKKGPSLEYHPHAES